MAVNKVYYIPSNTKRMTRMEWIQKSIRKDRKKDRRREEKKKIMSAQKEIDFFYTGKQ